MKKTASCVLILYILFGLIFIPGVCTEAAKTGIMLCINVVVPSLFVFFVCSKMLVKNGFAKKVSEPLEFLMRPLFNVPGTGAFAFVIGVLSGCPVGAKTVTDMYKNGLCTKTEAQRMICFCNNSGPLFIIGAVCTGMLGCKELGGVLYASHILSAVFTGILMSKYKAGERQKPKKFLSAKNNGNAFADSVKESVYLTGYVCGFVVFFAVAIATVKQSGIVESFVYNLPYGDTVKGVLYGMIEMTNGIFCMSGGKLSMVTVCAVSFVLGFGGLSVVLQVRGIVSGYGLSTAVFVCAKFVQGIFSFFITYILLSFSGVTLPVFSVSENLRTVNYWANSVNIFGIFVIILFLLSILIMLGNFLRRM